MKVFLKIVFAFLVAGVWHVLTHGASKEISIIFFFIVLFALFVRPNRNNNSAIREQYIQRLKENIKKNQEVNEEFSREKNMTYRDFRKKEK